MWVNTCGLIEIERLFPGEDGVDAGYGVAVSFAVGGKVISYLVYLDIGRWGLLTENLVDLHLPGNILALVYHEQEKRKD